MPDPRPAVVELHMAGGGVFLTDTAGAEEVERIVLTMSIHPFVDVTTQAGEPARISPTHVVAIVALDSAHSPRESR